MSTSCCAREAQLVWWAWPRWIDGAVRPATRDEWLEDWRRQKLRPEPLRVADAFTASGFRSDGSQTHPKALSVIARDAACSVASVKRFLKRARGTGRLTPLGHSVQLRSGLRRTHLSYLSLPAPQAPGTMASELETLAGIFPEPYEGAAPIWSDAPDAQPQ